MFVFLIFGFFLAAGIGSVLWLTKEEDRIRRRSAYRRAAHARRIADRGGNR